MIYITLPKKNSTQARVPPTTNTTVDSLSMLKKMVNVIT